MNGENGIHEAAYKRAVAYLKDRVQALNAQLQDTKNCRDEADSILTFMSCCYDDEVLKVQRKGKV